MSQHFVCLHCVKTNGNVRVQLGWDKPLSEFYLVVLQEPPAGQHFEEDQVVYSNLDDPRSADKDLAYYKSIATLLGCKVPGVMWRAAYQDREFNVVNKSVFYAADGAVVEPY